MLSFISQILAQIDKAWRFVATGICFAAFGIGGLVLWALVFPTLNALVWRRGRQVALSRTIIRLTLRGFIGLMHGLGVLRYQIIGREKLARQGLLVLANHPSLIDTVFLMAFVERADCIVKSRLWDNPFTRGPVMAAGYINNEHGAELVHDCIQSLHAGNNLIIFPEGTRTGADGAIRLKRGAANIAVRGTCDVTPVVIHCDPPTLGKGEKWWQVPSRRVQFSIEIKDDISVRDFLKKEPVAHNADVSDLSEVSEVLAARHLTDYLQHYFTEEKQHHA